VKHTGMSGGTRRRKRKKVKHDGGGMSGGPRVERQCEDWVWWCPRKEEEG